MTISRWENVSVWARIVRGGRNSWRDIRTGKQVDCSSSIPTEDSLQLAVCECVASNTNLQTSPPSMVNSWSLPSPISVPTGAPKAALQTPNATITAVVVVCIVLVVVLTGITIVVTMRYKKVKQALNDAFEVFRSSRSGQKTVKRSDASLAGIPSITSTENAAWWVRCLVVCVLLMLKIIMAKVW